MIWLAACGHPPEPPADPSCADPELRGERPFDRIELDHEPADEHRFWGAGVVAADLDQDGDIDLFAPGPASARLLRNEQGVFVDDPAALPELDWERTVGAVAGDVDADGDLDLVVTRWGGEDWLLLNDRGDFVAADAAFSIPSHSQSASLADADLDGDLDLAIAGHGPVEGGDQVTLPGPGNPTRLWLGDGQGGFTDASDRLEPQIRDGYTYVVGWTDLDGDHRPDWVVANDYPVYVPTHGAYNREDGFAVAGDRGLAWDAAGMGLGLADVNGDGVDDFLLPVWDRVVAPFSTGGSSGPWVDRAEAIGLRPPERDVQWVAWGGEWADIDADGDLDALIAWGHLDTVGDLGPRGGVTENAPDQRFTVYLQGPDGRFTESSAALGLDDVGVFRGFAVADLNEDGWPDLVRRDLAGRILIDQSRCGSEAWLKVVADPPVAAIGAEITVLAGGRALRRTIRAGGTSLASGGPPEALFGLGSAAQVDRIEVRWPDGEVEVLGPTAAWRTVTVRR